MGQLQAGQDQLLHMLLMLSLPTLRILKGCTSISEARQEGLVDHIIAYYDAEHPDLPHRVRCCVTGRYVDRHLVTGAHILPVAAQDFMGDLGFKDINTLRNTAPWCKPVERAWHEYKICFDGNFRLHVLDDALRGVAIADYADEKFRENLARDTNLGPSHLTILKAIL
ncbi:g4679 [Coccomyxa elongata]